MSNVLENLIKAAGTKNSTNARTDNLTVDPERFFKDVKNAKGTKSAMCHKDPDYDGGGLPEFARPIEGPSDRGKVDQNDQENAAQQKIDPKGHEKGHENGQQTRFLPNSSVTLIYGPPGWGKSYLLRKMYEEPPLDEAGNQAVNGVAVFTSTPADWAEIKKCCVREWSESVLAKLMLSQKNKKIKPHIVIILDDLLAKVNYDTQLMMELLTRHRHYNLSIIIAAQNITKTIHPIVRGQVSRFITFEPPSLESCRILYEAFCSSMWPNSRAMYQGIKDLSMLESHSYLVINVNTGESYVGTG